MCLAIPTRVVELLPDNQALVDLGGVRKAISLELVDGVAVGDYVIVHVGYALTRLDPEEAEQTLALMGAADGEAPQGVAEAAAGADDVVFLVEHGADVVQIAVAADALLLQQR